MAGGEGVSALQAKKLEEVYAFLSKVHVKTSKKICQAEVKRSRTVS